MIQVYGEMCVLYSAAITRGNVQYKDYYQILDVKPEVSLSPCVCFVWILLVVEYDLDAVPSLTAMVAGLQQELEGLRYPLRE